MLNPNGKSRLEKTCPRIGRESTEPDEILHKSEHFLCIEVDLKPS